MGHAVYAAGGSDFREVGKSMFEDEDDVLGFDPWEALGAIDEAETVAMLNRRYREKCAFWDDAVNMDGVYVTCMSGLIDLFVGIFCLRRRVWTRKRSAMWPTGMQAGSCSI